MKVKFINIYRIDYKIGPIKISITEGDIPPGIKFLKISRDVLLGPTQTIDLTSNNQEVITVSMICLRSGFFKLKGLVLNIRDKNNPKEDRILKYINDINFMVENEQTEKQETIMERTEMINLEEESLI